MASLRVHPDRLEIHLTPAEKTLAFRRENVVIARENIRSVTITDDPWIWVRGIRSPGALVPLVVAVGVWKFHGGKDFLAIKRRRQAVVIDLIGDDFARVILSTNHAPDLIASLKLEATPALDVPELDVPEPDGSAATAAPAAAEAPSAAAEPAGPVKPVRRTRTPKAVAPVEATDPVEPTAPVKPVRRARTAKAVTPVTPAETAETAEATPTTTPASPESPPQPAKRAKRASRTTAKPAAESEVESGPERGTEPDDLPESTA